MRILQVQQGTDAWHAERMRRFTASEAPAMMGASKYTSRSDLLQQKATGLVPEVTPQKQALFDRGHAAERPALAIVEEMIGEDLFPATAVHDTDDRLLASFDGVDMLESVIAEHKLWSEPLAAQVRAGDLEPHYYWQLEQQLLVSGAERAIFVCSDGTREKFVHMEYRPVPGRREALLAGWAQFEKDLAAYVPPSTVEKIVAEPVEALPAPVIQVTGQLALQDNFKVFEERLRHFLDNRLIREPKTDQDFADLDQQIKAMKAARESLKAAGAQMLAQVEPVEAATKRQKMLDTLLQQNVSMAERLLTAEKDRRKADIVAGGVKGLADHIAALNQRLGKPYMPQVPADFGGCIRGLKSLASMEDKVATELARAKASATEIASRIQWNLPTLRELASDFAALFPDTAQLVLKAPDDCRAQIESRIAAHKAEQERKLEAERARIRAEEAARVEREAQERAAAERRQREEQEALERRQREEEPAWAELQRQKQVAAEAEQRRQEAAARSLATVATAPAAGPAVIPMPTRAPAAPAGPPTLKLGDVNRRFALPCGDSLEGPVHVEPKLSEAYLAALGIHAAGRERGAPLFHEHQFPAICDALIAAAAKAKLKQLEAA